MKSFDLRVHPACPKHPLHSLPCAFCVAERADQPERRALPPDGPDVGSDVPGGGAT